MFTILRNALCCLAFIASASLLAQPANNDCANAIAIASVTDQAFTTIDATTDGPYHPAACVGGTTDSLYNDVWYLYTADFTGYADFSTCGTADFDTNIAVYPGTETCPPDAASVIACSEDASGCSGFTSKSTFQVTAGETYLLRIGGWGSANSPGGESGAGTFSVGPAAPPANDDCSDAIAIGSVSDFAFTTIAATTDGPYHPDACVGGTTDSLYYDVWYLYTADFTGEADFNTCGTADFDTNIAVYTGTATCPPDASDVIACSEDAPGCSGFTSQIIFDVVEGTTYLLRIGGWGSANSPGGEVGSGTFSIGDAEEILPPANDNCVDAIAIGEVEALPFDTRGANTDGVFHPTDCLGGNSDSLYNDVWYLYTATFTGTAEVSTCGTTDDAFDTVLAVYESGDVCPPGAESLLGCSDDAVGCADFTSSVVWDVEEGQTYIIRLGGYGRNVGGESGTGTLFVGVYVPVEGPENDDCVNAIELVLGEDGSVTVDFNTVGANTSEPIHTEVDAPGCLAPNEPVPYNDIWYSYTATFTGYVEYDNCGLASFDSKIAVYGPNEACPPSTDALVACGDDGCPGFTSVVNFPVEEGNTYLLRMGGWSASDAGPGSLVLRRIPPPIVPPNDTCDNAVSIPLITVQQADDFDEAFQGFTNNGSAAPGALAPSCITGNEYSDVWYSFNSLTNTELELRFSVLTPEAQFAIELYDACGVPVEGSAAFCFNTADSTETFLTFLLDSLPGVPTDYLMRVSSDLTFFTGGEFFFQLVGDVTTRVSELALENFKFYPNPANQSINAQFELRESGIARVEIQDVLGRLVERRELGRLESGRQLINMDVSHLRPGMHVFRLIIGEGQRSMKFVKQ